VKWKVYFHCRHEQNHSKDQLTAYPVSSGVLFQRKRLSEHEVDHLPPSFRMCGNLPPHLPYIIELCLNTQMSFLLSSTGFSNLSPISPLWLSIKDECLQFSKTYFVQHLLPACLTVHIQPTLEALDLHLLPETIHILFNDIFSNSAVSKYNMHYDACC
jgi:hypothetical protein